MSDRFFLDTNIFVYSFDKSAPRKAERAAKLIRRAIEAPQGIVSYQVAQEGGPRGAKNLHARSLSTG